MYRHFSEAFFLDYWGGAASEDWSVQPAEFVATQLRLAGLKVFHRAGTPADVVCFHGDETAGFDALIAAQRLGIVVTDLRRRWIVSDGAPCEPFWELWLGLSATVAGQQPEQSPRRTAAPPSR